MADKLVQQYGEHEIAGLGFKQEKIKCKIDELARLVHPRGRHPKLFVMLEAYLDESGVHRQAPVCSIAGYFGVQSQFRKFELDWRRLLLRPNYKVPLEKFNAKDLIKGDGFFGAWEPEKRNRFIMDAANVVANHKIYPVGWSVAVQDFNSPSLAIRFQNIVKLLLHWYTPADGKIHFFFGLDRPFAEYALALFRLIKGRRTTEYRERLGDVNFPMASETPQLQAADFLVYCTYREMQNRIAANKWDHEADEPLRTLIRNAKTPEDFRWANRDTILDAVKGIPIP